MKTYRRSKILFYLAVLLFTSCASYESLIVNTYKIESQKIKKGSKINIVLITDLHNDIYRYSSGGEPQEPLVEKIKAASPDIILLGGDIIDEKVPIAGTEILLSRIKDIAPIYYVSGNHEYYTKKIESIYSTLKSFGVIILSDTFVELNIGAKAHFAAGLASGEKIILCGIEDIARKKYYDKSYNICGTRQIIKEAAAFSDYKILLIHRPEHSLLYKDYGFDLMLSGHAHGGQLRIKGILDNGLYAPGQGLFPKYTGGKYTFDKGGTPLIVSTGLTTKRPGFMRIGNPPEIVVIQIAHNGTF